jgi:hypothetical protein
MKQNAKLIFSYLRSHIIGQDYAIKQIANAVAAQAGVLLALRLAAVMSNRSRWNIKRLTVGVKLQNPVEASPESSLLTIATAIQKPEASIFEALGTD